MHIKINTKNPLYSNDFVVNVAHKRKTKTQETQETQNRKYPKQT